MNPNSRKNRELIRQYPFVNDILNQDMEPYGYGGKDAIDAKKVDELTIQIQKADGNLMYRQARNAGLGDSSAFFFMEGPRKGQVMCRGEYVFLVNKADRVIERLDFPRNEMERRDQLEEVYAWHVLWASKDLNASGTGYLHSGPLWDMTKYIVWTTVDSYYKDTKNPTPLGFRLGEFKGRAISVTIYSEPDEGFEKLQEDANVYDNLYLDTRVLTRGVLAKDHEIVSICGMMHEMCLTFQDEVYFRGMKEVLDGNKFRGASGQFGSVTVLCAEMCGYDRIMLEDAMSYVTFQSRPGSNSLYVHGQQGTLPQIRNLVRTVVQRWNQDPTARATFQPDNKVSVL